VISATENSKNKFQKTRFWKEKSVEDVVTLGPTAQATLVIMKLRCHGHQINRHFQNDDISKRRKKIPIVLFIV
jgi:hypothetical protein